MRIVENAANRLVIAERPWIARFMLGVIFLGVVAAAVKIAAEDGLAGLIFGGPWIAALLAGGALVLFAGLTLLEATVLTLDRAAGEARIVRRAPLRQDAERYPLDYLRGARLETKRDEEGAKIGRLVLVFDPAMLETLAPAARKKRVRANRFNRRLGPADVPFTTYFSGAVGAEAAIEAIEAWLAG